MSCAHCGILLIGVNRPLSRIRITMKNIITKVACCIVSEWFEIMRPKPEMVSTKSVNSDDASGRCQSVEKPGEAEAECQDEESDRPVGDQFREDEGKFAYRRDVDLFDGPRLFLCDDIQRGHETA
mgnify:CR=1 FL=1